MIYKAQVVLFIQVPNDCQDPNSFVADALSTQLSENGIHNPDSEIADWHYALAPGTPSGYVWPEPATAEDLAETELL